MSSSVQSPKLVWFAICAAYSLAPVVYYVVGAQVVTGISASPNLHSLRPVFRVLAPLALLAGAFLVTRAPRARSDAQGIAALFGGEAVATPPAFQAAFVTATAFVESCAIFGFILLFLGAPLEEYLPYGVGTLTFMLGAALPTGLRYWREFESAGGGTGGPSAIE